MAPNVPSFDKVKELYGAIVASIIQRCPSSRAAEALQAWPSLDDLARRAPPQHIGRPGQGARRDTAYRGGADGQDIGAFVALVAMIGGVVDHVTASHQRVVPVAYDAIARSTDLSDVRYKLGEPVQGVVVRLRLVPSFVCIAIALDPGQSIRRKAVVTLERISGVLDMDDCDVANDQIEYCTDAMIASIVRGREAIYSCGRHAEGGAREKLEGIVTTAVAYSRLDACGVPRDVSYRQLCSRWAEGPLIEAAVKCGLVRKKWDDVEETVITGTETQHNDMQEEDVNEQDVKEAKKKQEHDRLRGSEDAADGGAGRTCAAGHAAKGGDAERDVVRKAIEASKTAAAHITALFESGNIPMVACDADVPQARQLGMVPPPRGMGMGQPPVTTGASEGRGLSVGYGDVFIGRPGSYDPHAHDTVVGPGHPLLTGVGGRGRQPPASIIPGGSGLVPPNGGLGIGDVGTALAPAGARVDPFGPLGPHTAGVPDPDHLQLGRRGGDVRSPPGPLPGGRTLRGPPGEQRKWRGPGPQG